MDTNAFPLGQMLFQTLAPVTMGKDHKLWQGSLHDTPEHCLVKWWFPFVFVEKAMFQLGKKYLLRSPVWISGSLIFPGFQPFSNQTPPGFAKGHRASTLGVPACQPSTS